MTNQKKRGGAMSKTKMKLENIRILSDGLARIADVLVTVGIGHVTLGVLAKAMLRFRMTAKPGSTPNHVAKRKTGKL